MREVSGDMGSVIFVDVGFGSEMFFVWFAFVRQPEVGYLIQT
jgi:hypothetical protein